MNKRTQMSAENNGKHFDPAQPEKCLIAILAAFDNIEKFIRKPRFDSKNPEVQDKASDKHTSIDSFSGSDKFKELIEERKKIK